MTNIKRLWLTIFMCSIFVVKVSSSETLEFQAPVLSPDVIHGKMIQFIKEEHGQIDFEEYDLRLLFDYTRQDWIASFRCNDKAVYKNSPGCGFSVHATNTQQPKFIFLGGK